MGKRLRVADPLPWLLLIGSLFASLWVFPLGLFQSQTFSSARASSYNDWVCGQSSMQPRWGAASASCKVVLMQNGTLQKCVQMYNLHSILLCRSGFAYDIELETQQVQAEIHGLHRQLDLFGNSSAFTSAYTQKHAVEASSSNAQRTTSGVHDSEPKQDSSKLQPFLFVGVLSVAGNAGAAT